MEHQRYNYRLCDYAPFFPEQIQGNTDFLETLSPRHLRTEMPHQKRCPRKQRHTHVSRDALSSRIVAIRN